MQWPTYNGTAKKTKQNLGEEEKKTNKEGRFVLIVRDSAAGYSMPAFRVKRSPKTPINLLRVNKLDCPVAAILIRMKR